MPRNEALRLPQPVPAAVVVMSDGRFAGVDWASEEHAVCVVDQRGRILEGRRYRHNEPGIRALCSRLLGLGVALVALERPDGLLIERLLDAGLTVVAVHPNQVKAMRPRYSVAGGKSDSFDSFVLAELARTDRHRFRVLEPDSDQTKALRSMTRARDGLVRTRSVWHAVVHGDEVPVELWEHEGQPQLNCVHDRLISALRNFVAARTGDPLLRLRRPDRLAPCHGARRSVVAKAAPLRRRAT